MNTVVFQEVVSDFCLRMQPTHITNVWQKQFHDTDTNTLAESEEW